MSLMMANEQVVDRGTGAGLTVRPMRTPEEEASWEEFVLRHPQASGYHTLTWKRLIEGVFGHRAHYLLSTNGAGEITGVLPLILTESWMFGRYLTSMPFVNYGGVLSDDEASAHALLTAAGEIAQQVGASHIEPCRWPARGRSVRIRSVCGWSCPRTSRRCGKGSRRSYARSSGGVRRTD